MTKRAPISCVTCGKPIVGCGETKHGGGWKHARTNSERCPPPHRTLAEPQTIADVSLPFNGQRNMPTRKGTIRPETVYVDP